MYAVQVVNKGNFVNVLEKYFSYQKIYNYIQLNGN